MALSALFPGNNIRRKEGGRGKEGEQKRRQFGNDSLPAREGGRKTERFLPALFFLFYFFWQENGRAGEEGSLRKAGRGREGAENWSVPGQ